VRADPAEVCWTAGFFLFTSPCVHARRCNTGCPKDLPHWFSLPGGNARRSLGTCVKPPVKGGGMPEQTWRHLTTKKYRSCACKLRVLIVAMLRANIPFISI
jgi:hypothetical protein